MAHQFDRARSASCCVKRDRVCVAGEWRSKCTTAGTVTLSFFFLLSAESAAGMRLPGSDNPNLDLNIHFSRVVSAEHTFITFFSVNIHAW
jgi:hypothetical protein